MTTHSASAAGTRLLIPEERARCPAGCSTAGKCQSFWHDDIMSAQRIIGRGNEEAHTLRPIVFEAEATEADDVIVEEESEVARLKGDADAPVASRAAKSPAEAAICAGSD